MGSKATWRGSGWSVKSKTVDELVSSVNRLGTFDTKRVYAWRGMRDVAFGLQPSVVRHLAALGKEHDEDSVREHEAHLVEAARAWPAPEFSGLPSDQDILVLFQHHGVPTSLLDVTTDPVTALWFACEEKGDASDSRAGLLLAMDVTSWPTLRTEPHIASYSAMTPSCEYQRELAANKPFLIDPSRPGGRIAAQRGRLLRAPITNSHPFGVDLPGVSNTSPPKGFQVYLSGGARGRGRPARLPFVAFEVSAAVKKKLRKHLGGTYGLTRGRLFPEMSGFVDAVRLGELP